MATGTAFLYVELIFIFLALLLAFFLEFGVDVPEPKMNLSAFPSWMLMGGGGGLASQDGAKDASNGANGDNAIVVTMPREIRKGKPAL